MHYEWGLGLGGDTITPRSSASGANWGHTQTGVMDTGRFHFFAVSKSGRASFQNNGQTGGATGAVAAPEPYGRLCGQPAATKPDLLPVPRG